MASNLACDPHQTDKVTTFPTAAPCGRRCTERVHSDFDDLSRVPMGKPAITQVMTYHDTVHNNTFTHLGDRQFAHHDPICVVQVTQCTDGRTAPQWGKW